MKQIITLFTFLFLLSNLVISQCLPDTVYQYDFIVSTQIKDNLLNRTIYQYDDNGNQIEELIQDRDEVNDSWINSKKKTWGYDENDNLVEQEGFSWSSNTWKKNGSRFVYTYDEHNNLIEELEQEVAPSDLWRNKYHFVNSYNANNQLTHKVRYFWVKADEDWVLSGDYADYTYDGNGNLTYYKFQSISHSTGVWSNSMAYYFTYDAQSNEIQSLSQQRLNNDAEWIFFEKKDYTYDSNNNRIGYMLSNWDNTELKWDKFRFDGYTYDSNGSLVELDITFWNEEDQSWRKNTMYTYEYSSEGDLVAQDHYSGWYKVGEYYNNHTRKEFICGASVTSVQEVSLEDFKLFPNPLNGEQLNIHANTSGEYAILDINGKTVQEGKIQQGNNLIFFQGIDAGMYFVRIGSVAHKLIKE